jgi:hypothetical protein
LRIVQLLASAPERRHEVGCLEKRQMLCHRLPAHVQMFAELAQGLAVVRMQLIEQFPAARIGERLEHFVHWLRLYATTWLHINHPKDHLALIGVFGQARKKSRHDSATWPTIGNYFVLQVFLVPTAVKRKACRAICRR